MPEEDATTVGATPESPRVVPTIVPGFGNVGQVYETLRGVFIIYVRGGNNEGGGGLVTFQLLRRGG